MSAGRFSDATCPVIRGAVDIGTSRVRVLVAEMSGESIRIIGVGVAASRGVRRGEIVDRAAAAGALGEALEEARRSAGARWSRVYLAVNGAHVGGAEHVGAAWLGGGRATALDWANARAMARAGRPPEGRCVVQHFPGAAEIDGEPVAEPTERAGTWLRTRVWRAHAHPARLADAVHQLRNFMLEPAQLVVAGSAAALAATTREEREAGVVVIDLGAGVTAGSLWRGGHLLRANVLPVGGGHLDRDLAVALRLRPDEAEAVKRRHGSARVRARRPDKARVWLDDNRGVGARELSLTAIEQVTAARIRETLELSRRGLGEAFRPEELRAGVVLTGGGAELAGLRELAAEVFGTAARIGSPCEEIGETLSLPANATVLGALAAGWEMERQTPPVARPGFWRRVLHATDYVLGAGSELKCGGRD